jgi:hypothetical protein
MRRERIQKMDAQLVRDVMTAAQAAVGTAPDGALDDVWAGMEEMAAALEDGRVEFENAVQAGEWSMRMDGASKWLHRHHEDDPDFSAIELAARDVLIAWALLARDVASYSARLTRLGALSSGAPFERWARQWQETMAQAVGDE